MKKYVLAALLMLLIFPMLAHGQYISVKLDSLSIDPDSAHIDVYAQYDDTSQYGHPNLNFISMYGAPDIYHATGGISASISQNAGDVTARIPITQAGNYWVCGSIDDLYTGQSTMSPDTLFIFVAHIDSANLGDDEGIVPVVPPTREWQTLIIRNVMGATLKTLTNDGSLVTPRVLFNELPTGIYLVSYYDKTGATLKTEKRGFVR